MNGTDNHRNTGGRQWDATRHEFTGPDGVIPANGLDKMGSAEFRQELARQARILGDQMRSAGEDGQINGNLEMK